MGEGRGFPQVKPNSPMIFKEIYVVVRAVLEELSGPQKVEDCGKLLPGSGGARVPCLCTRKRSPNL